MPAGMDLTVESILSRLHANRARLEKKVRSYATMMYSFFQIVASFEPVYRIAWRPSFARFTAVVGGVVFLNPFSMYPASCAGPADLHAKLVFYLCGYAGVHIGVLAEIARLSQQAGDAPVARKEMWMRWLIYFSNFFCEWRARRRRGARRL